MRGYLAKLNMTVAKGICLRFQGNGKGQCTGKLLSHGKKSAKAPATSKSEHSAKYLG